MPLLKAVRFMPLTAQLIRRSGGEVGESTLSSRQAFLCSSQARWAKVSNFACWRWATRALARGGGLIRRSWSHAQ